MQRFTSSICWSCPECSHTNAQNILVPELNFMAGKSSDMSTGDWIEIICEECSVAYTGHVWVHASGTEFELEDPRRFSFTGDIPMYEPDEEYFEPADDPYSISREALDQLPKLLGSPSPASDEQFTNRLVFIGAIASLEAYLADTLINAVQSDTEVRRKLLENNNKLGSLPVSALELARDPGALTKRIVQELRGVLYHNLRTVTALYRDAFQLNLAPSKATRDILFQAIEKRHDCVHRNGRDKEGLKLTKFTDDHVRSVISTISATIDHIESELTKDLPF